MGKKKKKANGERNKSTNHLMNNNKDNPRGKSKGKGTKKPSLTHLQFFAFL
jgi:hypothetical protein